MFASWYTYMQGGFYEKLHNEGVVLVMASYHLCARFRGAYFYNTMAKAPNVPLLIGVIALFSLIFIPVYLAIWRSIEKREARKAAKQHLRF